MPELGLNPPTSPAMHLFTMTDEEGHAILDIIYRQADKTWTIDIGSTYTPTEAARSFVETLADVLKNYEGIPPSRVERS